MFPGASMRRLCPEADNPSDAGVALHKGYTKPSGKRDGFKCWNAACQKKTDISKMFAGTREEAHALCKRCGHCDGLVDIDGDGANWRACEHLVWLTANWDRPSVINPDECSHRTYSSIFNDETCGDYHTYSMLDSARAWVGRDGVGDWMRIDAGGVTDIYGVRMQKRGDDPTQYVTQFTVEYSIDDATWTSVDGGRIFDGPTMSVDAVDALFTDPVTARYIRITVQEIFFQFAAMRAGLLGAGMEADQVTHVIWYTSCEKTNIISTWDDPFTYHGTAHSFKYAEKAGKGMMRVFPDVAERACSFIGARLPIVKSAEENHALFDFVDRFSKALPGDFDVEWGVWLAAGMVTDEAWEREGGAWLWADGTSFEVSRPGHTFW